jgi:hypothetical protein
MNFFYTFPYYLELGDIAVTTNVGFLPCDVKNKNVIGDCFFP